MNRKILILFSIIFVFWFTVNQTSALSEEIGTIELSKTAISLPLPQGYCSPKSTKCEYDSDDTAIAVTTSVERFKADEVTFTYIFTGGKIIGDGAKVIWDLSDVQPGTYRIFADIKNKSGLSLGKTNAKIITVFECFCADCFCPDKLYVSAPEKPIQAGEPMIFTANVSGGGDDITYSWTVSKGEIIEGQGTPSIKVATTPEMAGEEIKATVKFGGEAFCSGICYNEASAVGKIEKIQSKIDVESLTIDKKTAVIGCPPSWSPGGYSECYDEKERLILVTTKTSKTNEKDLDYYYFVSGGEILGKGANVIWDLTSVYKDGNYTITVGVGRNSIILGKTLTETIELLSCSCHESCECPDGITISGPKNVVKSGDLIVLKTEVSSGGNSLTVNWKISNGTIVSGQGTSQVLVKVASVMNETTLKATVEVGNDCAECGYQTDSKTIQIIKQK